QAEASARAIGASAYTLGRHILFGAGSFAPQTSSGRLLIAHELTHVVQQQRAGRASIQRQPARFPPPDPFAPGEVYDLITTVTEATLPLSFFSQKEIRDL